MIKVILLILCCCSGQVRANQQSVIGCATLNQGNAIATNIALIRAKARWVDKHYGKVVSGNESLSTDNSGSQYTQLIKTKSAGFTPSQSIKSYLVDKSIQDIDGVSYLCITLTIK